MNKRIAHIDIAKGISIALVAMFHSKLKILFPEIIGPMSLFRMPLFFFLSGVFFSASIRHELFVIKKSEALLKPYFSVLIFLFIISFCLDQEHLVYHIKGALYGNGITIGWGWPRWLPMWFLTHLFAVYYFSYILFRYAGFEKLPSVLKWVCLFVFFTIGVLNIDMFLHVNLTVLDRPVELNGLPFSIDIILVTSVFFIAGNLLRDKLIYFTPSNNLLLLSVITFLGIAIFTASHINLNLRIYENPIFATLGSISGIYTIMCLSYSINRYKSIKNIFIVLGGSSLYILIFHSFIGHNIYNIFENYVTDNNGMFLLSCMAFFLSILLPLAIKWAVCNNSFIALFFLSFKSNKLLQRVRYARR